MVDEETENEDTLQNTHILQNHFLCDLASGVVLDPQDIKIAAVKF